MTSPPDPTPEPSTLADADLSASHASKDAKIREIPIIGVLGAPGSGKSTVARIWGELGCLVIDSDAIARDILNTAEAAAELSDWWGPSVLDAGGAIDRAAVAKQVFADPVARTRLEAWVHPKVHAERARQREAAGPEIGAIVEDAPLLIEAGIDQLCDVVVFIESPAEDRIDRVHRTRGWTADQLQARESAQIGLDTKRSRANHILANDGTLDLLRERAAQLLTDICTSFSIHATGPKDPAAPDQSP